MTDPAATSSTQSIPELVELGSRLSLGREAKGLSIAALADRLRIGPDQLDALERGDRAGLREPVFVIAQAKRVAGALGIDVSEQIANLRASRFMQEARKPMTLPIPLTPALPSGGRSDPSAGLPLPPATHPARQGFPAPGPLLLAGLALAAALLGLVRGLRPPAPQAADQPVAETPAAPPSAPQATPLPSAAPGPATAPTLPSREELVLRAAEPSWLEVRDAAGSTLFQGTFSGEKRFPIGQGVEVKAGRPYAVTAQTGDRPPVPLGRVDEIVWRRFAAASTPSNAVPGAPPTVRPGPAPAAP